VGAAGPVAQPALNPFPSPEKLQTGVSGGLRMSHIQGDQDRQPKAGQGKVTTAATRARFATKAD